MGGPSQAQQAQTQAAQTATSLESQLAKEAQQLYGTTEPGLSTAENFYSQIASGNPQAIQSAMAPAISGIEQQYSQARQQALATGTPGGALQQTLQGLPIQEAGQIGQAETQAYASAFPALSSLGLSGVGASQGLTQAGTQALGLGAQTYGNIAQQQAQGKASTLGFLGSLGQAAGTAAGGGVFGTL